MQTRTDGAGRCAGNRDSGARSFHPVPAASLIFLLALTLAACGGRGGVGSGGGGGNSSSSSSSSSSGGDPVLYEFAAASVEAGGDGQHPEMLLFSWEGNEEEADETPHHFGLKLALSADGTTLAAASSEQSNEGAVYVFTKTDGIWSQQQRLVPEEHDSGDLFGGVAGGDQAIALSADGEILAVGSPLEDGSSGGFNGELSDNALSQSGAAYIFTAADDWKMRNYIKALNPDSNDSYGIGTALSADGKTLFVGAPVEDGSDTGVGGLGGDWSLNDDEDTGAVYEY